MNKISVFEHPEFGRIRTLEIDGKIWFLRLGRCLRAWLFQSTGCRRRHCKPMGVSWFTTPPHAVPSRKSSTSAKETYTG